ncbi:hypothetical protein ACJ41O_005492 [Fusarium nematophilum]
MDFQEVLGQLAVGPLVDQIGQAVAPYIDLIIQWFTWLAIAVCALWVVLRIWELILFSIGYYLFMGLLFYLSIVPLD